MNITLHKHNSADGLLTVVLSEEDYRTNVDKKIREYSRKATVKGFRKGKVPSSIINKMYGASILAEEVNEILSRSVSQYIADNKLDIIGEPLPNREKAEVVDWKTQKEFTFEFQLGLVNTFTYKLSPKIKLNSYLITVGDSTVDETIEALRKQFGKVTHPETSGSEDQLHGELVAESDEGKKHPVTIEAARLKQEAQKKFMEKKPGDLIRFDIDSLFTSDEYKVQFLNTLYPKGTVPQTGNYQFTINTISHIEEVPIDQHFFDNVFGKGLIQDEADFRKKVKERISQQHKPQTDRLLDQHIQEHFTENTRVNMPEAFLKMWLQQKSNDNTKESELDAALEAQKKILKWDIIKNKIAADLEIKVESEEVKETAKQLIARQYGNIDHTQLEDKLDAMATHYLSAEQGTNFVRLRDHLLNERVLNTIKTKITLIEKPVTLTDFKKVAEETMQKS